jgi:hypothetical protein
MYLPKFWKRGTGSSSDGAIETEVWGWSDTSEQEAAAQAASRAGSLAEAIARGERANFSNRPKGYNLYGANPLREPILEQVRSASGSELGVISRNAYGCDVLNTKSILFCDIDFDENQKGAPSGVFARLFGRKHEAEPSPEQKAMAKVRDWVQANADWGIEAYRTKAGLRLIATHDLFDPAGGQAEPFFDAVGADPYFRRLCSIQKSFRARLTPKPWRCGEKVPPSRWPFRNQDEERAFEQWRRSYETSSARNAVCRRLEHLGSSRVHPDVQVAMALHDQRTKTDSGLALA